MPALRLLNEACPPSSISVLATSRPCRRSCTIPPSRRPSIVTSIVAKDYPLVQGTVLVYGVGVLLINTLVDVVLALLDPRSAIGES